MVSQLGPRRRLPPPTNPQDVRRSPRGGRSPTKNREKTLTDQEHGAANLVNRTVLLACGTTVIPRCFHNVLPFFFFSFLRVRLGEV